MGRGEALTTLHRRQNRRNARKLAIKITRIRRTRNRRHKRRRDLLIPDIIPIDIPEERMTHDFLRIGRAGSQSQFGFPHEEFLEDGDGVAGHVDWVEGFVGEDGVVDFVFVFAAEGGLLEEHLVDEDAEGPPVDCAAVFFVEEDLFPLLV